MLTSTTHDTHGRRFTHLGRPLHLLPVFPPASVGGTSTYPDPRWQEFPPRQSGQRCRMHQSSPEPGTNSTSVPRFSGAACHTNDSSRATRLDGRSMIIVPELVRTKCQQQHKLHNDRNLKVRQKWHQRNDCADGPSNPPRDLRHVCWPRNTTTHHNACSRTL